MVIKTNFRFYSSFVAFIRSCRNYMVTKRFSDFIFQHWWVRNDIWRHQKYEFTISFWSSISCLWSNSVNMILGIQHYINYKQFQHQLHYVSLCMKWCKTVPNFSQRWIQKFSHGHRHCRQNESIIICQPLCTQLYSNCLKAFRKPFDYL